MDGDDVFGPHGASLQRRLTKKHQHKTHIQTNAWVYASWVLTCCIPTVFIRNVLGKHDLMVQQAYREKVALCIIIGLMMGVVGFLTFGFQNIVCPTKHDNTIHLPYSSLSPTNPSSSFAIHGTLYTVMPGSGHPVNWGVDLKPIMSRSNGADFGMMFPPAKGGNCAAFDSQQYPLFPCTATIPFSDPFDPNASVELWPNATIAAGWQAVDATKAQYPTTVCHPPMTDVSQLAKWQGDVIANFSDVVNMKNNHNKKFMVFSGNVLDITLFFDPDFDRPKITQLVQANNGKDATLAFSNAGALGVGVCLTDYLKIAKVDAVSPNCLVASVVVWITLMIILLVVLAQFFLALYFKYMIGWRLGSNKAYRRAMEDLKRRRHEYGRAGEARQDPGLKFSGGKARQDMEGDIIPYNPHGGGAFGVGPSLSVHTRSSNEGSFEGRGTPFLLDTTSSSAVGSGFSQGHRNSSFMRLNGLGSRSSVALNAFSGSRNAAYNREVNRDVLDPSRNWNAQFGFMEIEGPTLDAQTDQILSDPTLMHCLCLVTCYSEGESSLKATLNSIAHSYYPGTHKVLFVIADGIVKGSDNAQTTPDLLIDMIEVDERFPKDDPRGGGSPEAYSYVAIADGANRKNYAKVYAGWYKYDTSPPEERPTPAKPKSRFGTKRSGNNNVELDTLNSGDDDTNAPAHLKTLKKRSEGKVPMILIVKVGNDEERDPNRPAAKPGNRGKRDSQVLLMNFLAKVMFDDRMTELEFDIFFKLFTITGVNPEKYEALLMVDADTRVYPDALSHMIACLLKDDRVMGLCGETKISNKWDSWVTMIQVFEYFISHHMTKAFESVFGGCTCLPGCFSMYRIKTPKGPNGFWVPILANPDIVEEYSEHVVDTLHKKNLLLLGEDRFLSTMMLRSFPKRRMVFCPPAICKTVVPDTFKVLLSQRRRWINSTIHNLMELLLVNDLCGTFCISMQFVIFMNLVGTVVLPAAITFTITILILTVVQVGADTTLPLILLALILGLPAILILLTANRPIYIFWMLVYLLSLPVWNFVLPLYAFWNFDDFSWGATRKVAGEDVNHDHSKREGEFDGKGIHMKRWSEWVK
ncbi:Chitin synthase, class 3, partial [Podochytrium sp. JEL0797]